MASIVSLDSPSGVSPLVPFQKGLFAAADHKQDRRTKTGQRECGRLRDGVQAGLDGHSGKIAIPGSTPHDEINGVASQQIHSRRIAGA